MSGSQENEDEAWWQPSWETDDEVDPPGAPRPRLRPWPRACERGWPAHAHIWIHPQDLALRDAGLAGSYGAAAQAGRLERELPATAARESGFDVAPSDLAAEQALRLTRLWRRLAEFRTWAPLADAAAMRETLRSLGCRGAFVDAHAEDWLASSHTREQGPVLIRAGRAARDWMNWPGTEVSRHKSLDTLRGYVRRVDLFKEHAEAAFL